jgi:hypothetical protein
MIKLLHVPTVFFDARWPTPKSTVDVLVIDRAGTGDVHVINIYADRDAALQSVPKLLKVPAQFRWIAFPADTGLEQLRRAPLFPETGMGRVGVIILEQSDEEEIVNSRIAVRAERFPGSFYDEADAFLSKHKPDIMFR